MASTYSDFLSFQTGFIFAIRVSLFYACHRFLLSPLFHDLQSLTLASTDGESIEEEYELVRESPDEPQLPSPASTVYRARTNLLGHSNVSQWIFSVCFSETSILFMLVMFQALGILSGGAREINWDISMSIILAMILLVIPLTEILLLTFQSSHGRRRPLLITSLLTLMPYGLYIFFLCMVPVPVGMITPTPWNALFSRLIVVGTVILGVLSGFGAVSNAWDFFPIISRSKRETPTDQDIVFAEQSLTRIRNDLLSRRQEQERRSGTTPRSNSWLSSIVPKFRSNAESTALQQEITGLEALEYQMSRNLEFLIQECSRAKFARTFRGRILNFAGRLFAVYCIFRMLSSIINITVPLRSNEKTPSYPDIVTHFLAYTMSLMPIVHMTDEEVAAISRQISLVLIGTIILTNVRLILRRVSRVLSLTSKNLGASLLLLMLAQLMCMYLLSSLVQLRTAFPHSPPSPATESSNLFTKLPEYEVFGMLFDGSFLLTATLSIVIRWIDVRINGV